MNVGVLITLFLNLDSISIGYRLLCHTFIFTYFFKIYFHWSLITLQYCIGFAIHQHESSTGIHVFPILNPPPTSSPYHPSGSSQCTSPKRPVSASNLDWHREGLGRGVQDGEHVYTCGGFMLMCSKTNTICTVTNLQLK